MFNKIDFKFLTLSVVCLGISLLTVAGIIQEYMHFADPINEIGFTCMSLFGGVLFALGIKK